MIFMKKEHIDFKKEFEEFKKELENKTYRLDFVGMLIFNVLLGVVSPIFFIINFVRMKRNRAVIERILQNQQAWR